MYDYMNPQYVKKPIIATISEMMNMILLVFFFINFCYYKGTYGNS